MSQESTLSSTCIDLTELWTIVGNDEEIVMIELLTAFQESAAQRLTAMQKAVEQGDRYRLELEAHTLKSSSRNVGANQLADLCYWLEKLSRSNALELAAPKLKEVESEYSRVDAALNRTIAALKS